MREFLFVDDMAAASLLVLELAEETYQANTRPMLSHINVGTGVDVTIRELAQTMKRVVGFEGELIFDTSKSDGAPRKLIDVSRLSAMGWQYSVELEDGLKRTYDWWGLMKRLDNGLFSSIVANTPLDSIDLVIRNSRSQVHIHSKWYLDTARGM